MMTFANVMNKRATMVTSQRGLFSREAPRCARSHDEEQSGPQAAKGCSWDGRGRGTVVRPRRDRQAAAHHCGQDVYMVATRLTAALLHAREGPMASPPVCTRPRLQTQHACLQTCITPCCVCQEMANLCEREIRLHVCKRPFTARLERLQTCVHAFLASVKMNNCMFANVTLNYRFTFANVNSWSCEARLQTLSGTVNSQFIGP